MQRLTSVPFNPKPPTIMHIDLNSAFATIEQQADPSLRGKPVAVCAYTTDYGCVVAPSVEAKKLGVKTGMRVKDARLLAPDIVVLAADPPKYRTVHLALKKLLLRFTEAVVPKSIDEFVYDFEGTPSLKKGSIEVLGKQIKTLIKREIGEHLTVSVGIGPNRFTAKTAAGLRKPDGLDVLDKHSYEAIYKAMALQDVCGIAEKNAARLHSRGMYNVWDFYNATTNQLKSAFQSINGNLWYFRLRGWELDDVEFTRRSFGNSYSLPVPYVRDDELSPVLYKLVMKSSERMRKAGFAARGVHIAVVYRDYTHWHKGAVATEYLYDLRDIYKAAFTLMCRSPYRNGKQVKSLAVSLFDLAKDHSTQLDLYADVSRKRELSEAIDKINERYGEYVITPARMLGTEELVPDRISFGGVKELEEYVTEESVL